MDTSQCVLRRCLKCKETKSLANFGPAGDAYWNCLTCMEQQVPVATAIRNVTYQRSAAVIHSSSGSNSPHGSLHNSFNTCPPSISIAVTPAAVSQNQHKSPAASLNASFSHRQREELLSPTTFSTSRGANLSFGNGSLATLSRQGSSTYSPSEVSNSSFGKYSFVLDPQARAEEMCTFLNILATPGNEGAPDMAPVELSDRAMTQARKAFTWI